MYSKFVKRIIDFVISLISLLILSLPMVIISIVIKVFDNGPVFYRAERIGKNSTKLIMLKFRTMKVDSKDIRNDDGSTFNSKNDIRVTKVGRILRETSLDELPQLFNVLKGNMSLIGPRASMWDALDTFKVDEIKKMDVKPGITGYTQAYYRNGLSVREKRLLDAWYAENYSFILDVKILIRTFKTIFLKENLYTNKK